MEQKSCSSAERTVDLSLLANSSGIPKTYIQLIPKLTYLADYVTLIGGKRGHENKKP